MRRGLFVMFLTMLFSTAINAREKTFMRFYSREGKRFSHGFYNGVTDTSVFVFKNNKKVEIPIHKIGVIKLRRGAGHTGIIGAAIGGATLAALFVSNADKDGEALSGPGVSFVGGLVVGGSLGGLVGSVISYFEKSVSFKINGNITAWQEQKNLIARLPSTNK